MRTFKHGLSLFLFASLVGCGSPAERLIKEQIQIMNELAERMETGKLDPSEATAMQARAMEIAKKQQELNLSPEEKKRVAEKYMPEIQKATARLMAATQKMTGKPHPLVPGMPGGMSPPNVPEASKPADKEEESTKDSKPRDDGKHEDDKKPPSL
jgi:hypothetical protein